MNSQSELPRKKEVIDWELVRAHFLSSNAGRGLKGEEFVEGWLLKNGYDYLHASDLMWDDSDEYRRVKKECDERVNLGPDSVLYWREYSEFLDGFGKRRGQFKTEASYRRHLQERKTAYHDYRKGRIYEGVLERYDEAIQKTRRFFEGKREEEERVKVFVGEMRQLQRQLNAEKIRQVKGPAKDHWGSHTAMFPDFLARSPDLTFIEVKTNNSKVETRQALLLRKALDYGFGAKVARVSLSPEPRLSLSDFRRGPNRQSN